MAGNCGYDPLARLCRRASEHGCGYIWLDGPNRPYPCRPERPPENGCLPPYRPPESCCRSERPPANECACRQRPFWPCWMQDNHTDPRRPQICCHRCGCCDRIEIQGRFVRCCACGWIGILEECLCACRVRSCCDNLIWPHRPGEPR